MIEPRFFFPIRLATCLAGKLLGATRVVRQAAAGSAGTVTMQAVGGIEQVLSVPSGHGHTEKRRLPPLSVRAAVPPEKLIRCLGSSEERAEYSHQLQPVRPRNSFFSEFHTNVAHPPSPSLFPDMLAPGTVALLLAVRARTAD